MQIAELKTKLNASLEHLRVELSKIRTGRASPSLIEDILVDSYGSKMRIKELGSIIVSDAQTIVISPWDKGLLKSIEKAIRESRQSLNPATDGDVVRLPIPALTEDRRKEFVKTSSSRVEEGKNSMRNVRQDAMKDIDKSFSDKTISEDEKFAQKEEVEDVVKEFINKAEELGENKKNEIMKI